MRINRVARASGSSKRPWPEAGKPCMKCRTPILKGQPYQWVQGFRGPKKIICGTCVFSRSDMTNSLKAGIYDAFDGAYADLDTAGADADLEQIRDTIVEAIREVEEQYRSTADEYFGGQGPQAEAADECDSVASDLESLDVPEIDSFEDWRDAQIAELTDTDEPLDEDELESGYAEYVDEQIAAFREDIENADQL